MPILDVEIVLRTDERIIGDLAADIAVGRLPIFGDRARPDRFFVSEQAPALSYILSLEDAPSRDDVMEVYNAIVAYNTAQVGDHWTGRLNIFARDPYGKILGGIYGFTDRGWLRIEVLVVKDGCRRQGMGARLLCAAEAEARARGCHDAWLDTFSFQALPFYERHGYVIFGVLENYPTGHTRYFVRKSL